MWPRHGSANDSLPQQTSISMFTPFEGLFEGFFSQRLPRLCGSLYPVVCLTNKCLQRALVTGDRALNMRARKRQLIF